MTQLLPGASGAAGTSTKSVPAFKYLGTYLGRHMVLQQVPVQYLPVWWGGNLPKVVPHQAQYLPTLPKLRAGRGRCIR